MELCFTVSLAWSEEGKRLGYEYGFRGYSRLQVRGGGGQEGGSVGTGSRKKGNISEVVEAEL